jgi:hypothetical protein
MESGYRNKRIDWNLWTNLRHVKVWEACALSLQIDPDTMDKHDWSRYRHGPGGGFHPGEPPGALQRATIAELKTRIRLVDSHLSNREFFAYPDGDMDYSSDVRLREFANFMVVLGRKPALPEELMALVGRTVTAPTGTSHPAAPSGIEGDGTGRENILDPAIEGAISAAGSLEMAKVFLVLREAALAGTPPFTGTVTGDGLWYTDAANQLKALSTDALYKRLKRRREKQPE